jgi:hypothetical protein
MEVVPVAGIGRMTFGQSSFANNGLGNVGRFAEPWQTTRRNQEDRIAPFAGDICRRQAMINQITNAEEA